MCAERCRPSDAVKVPYLFGRRPHLPAVQTQHCPNSGARSGTGPFLSALLQNRSAMDGGSHSGSPCFCQRL